ncbi:leucine-rich repeat-containing protein 15-like isoform X2 [Cynoglossus semilaevis]|uniref:leucine-rich repeat-containing protein 15-like isoform X2 n=1 Tax=Cynoglossus semilaevis TaxID=244447 RepID=UPI000D625D9F|nr:leucine-rich repeat-containing protein 15-like isoform X2 [Cynoglossus semilaevis]
MDAYTGGYLQFVLVLVALPHFTCDDSSRCPSACVCRADGAVRCVGDTVTDVPQLLPPDTYLLELNGTRITVIKERDLMKKDLLLRFSLTYSSLNTIHPQAFHLGPPLRSVRLSYNYLNTLPDSVFRQLTTLEQLYLNGNQFEVIGSDQLTGLTNLVALDLSRNKLTYLDSDVFQGLKNLTFLNLCRNFLKRLPTTVFNSLTNLQELHIYNNELEVLQAGLFDQLVNLRELQLYHNKITTLAPQVFWSLQKLTVLSLSSNQLTSIPEKSFYNMPRLTKLTIYKNPLLFLPEQLMGNMPEIQVFYLFSTNLTTVPGNLFTNMSGLLELNFHLNEKLKELPPDLFCCLRNLKKLSLKSNNLHDLEPQLFSRLPALKLLFLNDNKLRRLPENIFRGIAGVLTINLSKNLLTTLPGDIFQSNTALRSLSLSDNPWDCTCNIRVLARWIARHNAVVTDKNYVMCESPLYQMLRRVDSLPDEEFNVCDVTTYFPSNTDLDKSTQPLFTSTQNTIPPTTTTTTTTPEIRPSSKDTQNLNILTTTSRGSTSPASWTLTTQAEVTSTMSTMSTLHVFYDVLVIGWGPEFVHHNIHSGWVYVWFLPSDTAWTASLMFCHVFLLTTGLVFILASIYVMNLLDKTMDELNPRH